MKSIISFIALGAIIVSSVATVSAEEVTASVNGASGVMSSSVGSPSGTATGPNTKHVTNTTKTPLTAEQVACVRTAVAKRELAISTAFSSYASSVSTAYAGRASALDLAWTMTDTTARRTAVRNAWSTWKSAAQSARTALRTSKTSAWTAFKSDAAACKVSTAELDSTNALADSVQ